MYLPIAALAAMFVCAYAVAVWGAAGVVMTAAGFAAGCLLDFRLTGLLAAAFVPLAVAAGLVVRKRMRMRHGVLVTGGAALFGASAAVGVLWLYTGLGPIDYMTGRLEQLLTASGEPVVRALYGYVRFMDMLMGSAAQSAAIPASEAAHIILEKFRGALNETLVGGMVIYALLAGLLGFAVTRAFVKKKRKVAAVPAFSELALPPRFWLGYLLSSLAALVGVYSGWPSFDTLAQTISSVYGFVFTVQALSFLDFLYKRKHMQKAVRVLLHVAVTLFLGSLLVWVGLFENLANLRKRMDTEGGMVS